MLTHGAITGHAPVPLPPTVDSCEWLTADEGAAHLRVTRRTFDRYRAEGRITTYELGPRLKRFSRRELDALMRPAIESRRAAG